MKIENIALVSDDNTSVIFNTQNDSIIDVLKTSTIVQNNFNNLVIQNNSIRIDSKESETELTIKQAVRVKKKMKNLSEAIDTKNKIKKSALTSKSEFTLSNVNFKDKRKRTFISDSALTFMQQSKRFKKYAATNALKEVVQAEAQIASTKKIEKLKFKKTKYKKSKARKHIDRIDNMMFERNRIRFLSAKSEFKKRTSTLTKSKFIRTCALTKRLHSVILTQVDNIRTLLRFYKKEDMSEKVTKIIVTYKEIAIETKEMKETYLKTYSSEKRLFNHDENAKGKFIE